MSIAGMSSEIRWFLETLRRLWSTGIWGLGSKASMRKTPASTMLGENLKSTTLFSVGCWPVVFLGGTTLIEEVERVDGTKGFFEGEVRVSIEFVCLCPLCGSTDVDKTFIEEEEDGLEARGVFPTFGSWCDSFAIETVDEETESKCGLLTCAC